MAEAKIQVGEHVLTEAQAMAVRVAVSNFRDQLEDSQYREDLGPIADAYRARMAEVERILVDNANAR